MQTSTLSEQSQSSVGSSLNTSNGDLFKPYKRFGAFGPSESGKSTLAKKISLHLFRTEGRKSLVLDPVAKDNWGAHATVFESAENFLETAQQSKNALIIIDDASVTIDRDKTFNGVFTVMRHEGHKVLVIAHGAQNLLPQMRDQLQRIFLFLQNEESIKKFGVLFPGHDLGIATQLGQYEFITVANHQPLLRYKLTK